MKRWLLLCLSGVLLCMSFYAVGRGTPTDLQRAVQNGEMVRIHILAHDDTERQQTIKLAVRDAILQVFTPLLQKTASGAEAKRIITGHLDLAKETAETTARAMGFTQEVRVEFGKFVFPERTYGGQVVPAGEYQALRVLLGDAAGKNWWCVMYPPLCFSGEDYTQSIRFESSVMKWFRKWKKEILYAIS